LYAARLLYNQHEITVYEGGDYAGGHTNTVMAEIDGVTTPVDTGFIVYNERNYPLFTRLLNELDVTTQRGDMSFSLSCRNSGLEYSGSTLNTLFAQRRNLLRPSFYKMLAEIARFNRLQDELLAAPATETLADYLQRHNFSGPVVDDYLVPMAAAIWSAEPASILDFPAAYFGRFFANHGLLSINDRPQWRTIVGGSSNYVAPLIEPFRDRVRLKHPVSAVTRTDSGVKITANGQTENYDQVIIACHSDQALQMLTDPNAAEREILGAIPYQPNETVLHTDTRLLPEKKLAWAAWNYHRFSGAENQVSVTYHMSMLQKLDSPLPLLVSLNATGQIDPAKILRRINYEHPVYDTPSVTARARWGEISGCNSTHYCGAYWGYGFHEDGLRSAAAVVASLTGANPGAADLTGTTTSPEAAAA